MHIDNIGLLGWLHTLACVSALIFGAWNIVVFDRGANHRLRGLVYSWSMVVANVLVFTIYKFDINFASNTAGANTFGFFHWLAVSALAFTALGWFAAYRQRHGVWAYVHPIAMVLGYYVLVGGLINELFARVEVLRAMAYTVTESGRRFGSPVVGMTQSAAMLATFLLIVLFAVRVGLRRRKRKQLQRNVVPAAA